MLAYILAIAVGLGSFALYMAAFLFPEVHRKSDFIWSGVGLFYALILWVCAGRFTGAILLGQMSSVALLGWLGWQTLTLRREVTAPQLQTPIPDPLKRRVSNWFGGPKPAPTVQSPQVAETQAPAAAEPEATEELETAAEAAIADPVPPEVVEEPAPVTVSEEPPAAPVAEEPEAEVINPAIAPTEGEVAQIEMAVDESAAESVAAPDEPPAAETPELPETPAVVGEVQPSEEMVAEEVQSEEERAKPEKKSGGLAGILAGLKGLLARRGPKAPPEPEEPVSAGETSPDSDWDESDETPETEGDRAEPVAAEVVETEAVSAGEVETPPAPDTLGAIAVSEGTARNISNVEVSEVAEPPGDILGAIADAEEMSQPEPAADVSPVEETPQPAAEPEVEIVESVVSETAETEEQADIPERSPFETMMADAASQKAIEEVLETKSPAEPEGTPASEEPPSTAIDRSPEAEPDPPAEVSESATSEEESEEEGEMSEESEPEAETTAESDSTPDAEEAEAEAEEPPALKRPQRPKSKRQSRRK